MNQDLATLQVISETLKEDPQANQRTLAKNADMSLGMMNAILKRFVERGWIMLTNVNGRKLAYAVTPEGIKELAIRGRNFALRTFKLANEYNEVLYDVISRAKADGKKKVVLYGDSYIKFIIKFACCEAGMEFEEKSVKANVDEDAFCVVGEQEDDEVQEMLIRNGCVNLIEMVISTN